MTVHRETITPAMRQVMTVFVPLLILALLSSGCQPPANPTPTQAVPLSATPTQSSQTKPTPTRPAPLHTATPHPAVPYELLSQESIFSFLEDLTSIQPYSGWRNSASAGEAEALDYVEKTLGEYTALKDLGLELERQSFPVFLSAEIWETRLHLTLAGKPVEVPANGLRGSRYDPTLARQFDSDGAFNDAERNPLIVTAPVVLVRDSAMLYQLTETEIQGKVIFLDYALVDTSASSEAVELAAQLAQVIAQEPVGLVLVTRYSNQPGESHGSFVGDGGVFQRMNFELRLPILYVRIEDLAPAGITGWEDFAKVESARLVWDQDVFLPGQSGNLAARIPGADPSKAVILSAHIDSPNSPGAFDNGAGSAVMLEIARVLNASGIRPAVDLYLV